MKLQVLSDLHLEMMDPSYSWRIPQTLAEVVILAGDVGVGIRGVQWAIDEMERLGKTAIYVPGNHEYYGERLTVLERMRRTTRGSRVHVLDMEEVVIGDERFLGATLWTDYLLFGRAARPDAMNMAKRLLNDHRLINQPYGFTPVDALELHERGRAWLEAKLAVGWNGPTIVVTHHAPSLLGTNARFRGNQSTAAFVSDLEQLIEKHSPTLWVYGHTHHCARYLVGGTSVVANQMGYPHEPATGQFDPFMVIDV
jgi:predicted phosphodiesterase